MKGIGKGELEKMETRTEKGTKQIIREGSTDLFPCIDDERTLSWHVLLDAVTPAGCVDPS